MNPNTEFMAEGFFSVIICTLSFLNGLFRVSHSEDKANFLEMCSSRSTIGTENLHA